MPGMRNQLSLTFVIVTLFALGFELYAGSVVRLREKQFSGSISEKIVSARYLSDSGETASLIMATLSPFLEKQHP